MSHVTVEFNLFLPIIFIKTIVMKTVLFYIGSFILGAVLMAIIAFQYLRDVPGALMLLRQGYLHQNAAQSSRAYFTQSPQTAIWEYENLVGTLTNSGPYPANWEKDVDFSLFVAHARLAKLYDSLGNHKESETHWNEASNYYHQSISGHNYTNAASVQKILERIDAKEKAEGQSNAPALTEGNNLFR